MIKHLFQILFVLMLLLSEASVFFTPYKVDAAPVVEGNTVRMSLNDAYIEATPATLTASGWVDVTFWTRYYDGAVDVVYGFNGLDNVKAVNPEVWESYEHTKYRQVPAVKTAEFKPTKIISTNTMALRPVKADTDLSLNSKYAEIVYEQTNPMTKAVTQPTIKLAYDTYDAKTGAYLYKYNGTDTETYYETYTDWNKKSQPVTNTLSHAGANKWDVAQYKSVVKNEVQKTRVWIDIPFGGVNTVSGKYNIGIKPSSLTLQQAKDQGKLWLLDPWYSASWAYRKSIVIAHTDDGAQTDYQMKLTVHYGGADGDDNEATGLIHMPSASVADYDDLRFTESDGTTLLDYWIESKTDSTTAEVWVETDVAAHPTDTTIYMYYGNAGASAPDTSQNMGIATFPFFDHFDGDASKWSGDTASLAIASSVGTLTGAGAAHKKVYGNVACSGNGAFRARTNLANADYSYISFADSASTYNDCLLSYHSAALANHSGWDTWKAGGSTVNNNTDIGAGSYHIYDLIRLMSGTDTARYFKDNVQVGGDYTTNIPIADLKASMMAFNTGVTVAVDWVLQRKFTYTEPTWSSFGAEAVPSCALTGTVTTAVETDIVTGGETIILTLTNSTWVATGAVFDAIRDDIITGMDSAQNEANGWDAEYKANAAAYVADVVRTSDTVVTVTMSALATYAITADETITVTVPTAALVTTAALVASPTFTITKPLPLVSTQATSVITTTSALGNGTISDLNGGGNATVRGFEYDIDSGAPYAHEAHDNGSFGVAAYTKTMSGLTSGELYYNRAYATTPLGNGYGAEVIFLTLPTDPVSITATAVSTTEIDLIWPAVVCGAGTTVNYYVRANLGSAPTFSGAGGTTIYNSTLLAYNHTPLISGEHWYYRMWVRITDGGLEQYSTNFAADDDTAFTPPTVTTGICSGVGTTWAVLNGNVTATGSPTTITQRGFDYGLNTTYGSSILETGNFSTGVFYRSPVTLSPSTLYHYRAKAYNGTWAYGSDAIFCTKGSPALTIYFNAGSDNCTPIYGVNWASENFTTSTTTEYTVTSVRLLIKRVGTPGTIYVGIRKTAAGVPTGVNIASGSIDGDTIGLSETWYDFTMTPEVTLELNTTYAIVVSAPSGTAANYACWRMVNAGGYAGGMGMTSATSGLTWSTWTYDYMFELWGNQALEIQDAKVFQSYKATDDWLVTVRYVNVYVPYYDTYDVKKYFTLQLVDAAGTVKASTVMPAWGNRVGSIYLSATTVSPLTYGGDYRVRIQGTFTGTPYTEYALVGSDWLGSDLTNLDSWILTSSTVIGTYYATSMTSYIAERGEVLNSTGAGVFSAGIAGLSQVRPEIFQTYTVPSAYVPGTITQAGRTAIPAWQTNVGPDATVMLTRVGNIVGIGGDIIAIIAFLIMMFILMALAFPAGNTTAALVLSLPMLGAAIWFGMDLLYIGMLALIAGFLFVKNFWIDKGN